jgi:hypothetical protein
MAEYENKNSGVLFINDRKTDPKHPDQTGTWFDKDGVEHYLDAWVRETKTGKQIISLRAKPKQAKVQKQEYSSRPLSEELDDTVPF